jgi:hypothetical protein
MKTLQTLTFILILGFFSCNEKTENSVVKKDKVLTESKKADTNRVSNSKFVVDDYSVTNEMFSNKSDNNSNYKKQSGQIISNDKVWFGNDKLKQTLVFELYTDYHRLVTYHFLNNDIPTDLINRMELHIESGELATNKKKQNDFEGFSQQTTTINSSYFITEKGFRLGDLKEKAIENYGKPDKITSTDKIEVLEWSFIGDNSIDERTNKNGKPIAENSFGHNITMYFRNGKLIGQILHNEIP